MEHSTRTAMEWRWTCGDPAGLACSRLQDLSVDELKLDPPSHLRTAWEPISSPKVSKTWPPCALRQYGCTITQGHVHSPPLPADELHAWLVNRPPHLAASRQAAETLD